MGVHLRKLEQKYMKKQRKIKENHFAQQLLWLLKKYTHLYNEEPLTNNDNEKIQYFLKKG